MDDNNQKSTKKILAIVIFLVIIFMLFTVNIKSLVNSTSFKNNVEYAKQKIEILWNDYLLKSFNYILGKVSLTDSIKVDPATINQILNTSNVTQKIIGNIK